MARRYEPPREGVDHVGHIDGYPDHRGLPTIRVVCEGRQDNGEQHKELVVATFNCLPFDPTKECGNWFWDRGVAVGGGKLHPTTRIREDVAKRKVTEEEEAAGWRPGYTELTPKRHIGTMATGGTLVLTCPRCPRHPLPIKEADLQAILDGWIVQGKRKLPLPLLMKVRSTQPPKRQGR